MYKILLRTGLAMTLFSFLNAGGGKGLSPVMVPVVPIETIDPSPWYIGAGLLIGRYNYCEVECEYEDVTYGLMVRGGYEWNQYIGVEARALGTFWDADPLGGEKLQHVGIFAKPSYPLGEDANVYGLLGYGWTKTSTNSPYLPEIDEKGFSWGIGFEYDLSDKDDDYIENGNYDREFDGQEDQEIGWGLFIDYQRLLVKSGMPDMDVVSVGVTYDF
jgi:OOP family OmpA-OmpF porin